MIGKHTSALGVGGTGVMMTQNTNFNPVGQWGVGSVGGVIAPGTTIGVSGIGPLNKFWENMQTATGPPPVTTPWTTPMMIVDNFSFILDVATTGAGDFTWSVNAQANTPDGKTNTWAAGPITAPPFPFGNSGAMGGIMAPNNIIGNGHAAANNSLVTLLPDNGANYIGMGMPAWQPGHPPATGPLGAAGGNPYLFKRGTWTINFVLSITPAAINQHTTQLPAVFNTWAYPSRLNIGTVVPASLAAWSQFLIDTRSLSSSSSWTLSSILARSSPTWVFSFAWGIIGVTSGGDYSQGVTGNLLNLNVSGACSETIGSGY